MPDGTEWLQQRFDMEHYYMTLSGGWLSKYDLPPGELRDWDEA
jgi:hypothetical protein